MIQISFYQTENIPVEKTVTQLVEKCYNSGLKCTILFSDNDYCEHLNKHLWTYSQKQFIPHGSKSDLLPEIQPIYLTDTLENVNNSTVAILVNCNIEMLRNVFEDLNNISKLGYERLILIFNLDDNSLVSEFKIIKEGLASLHVDFDYFKQSPTGWLKEPK